MIQKHFNIKINPSFVVPKESNRFVQWHLALPFKCIK